LSAIFASDHYTSRLETKQNSLRIKKIEAIFEDYVQKRQPGEYEIRWNVTDGQIGTIYKSISKFGGINPDADVRLSMHCLSLDIEDMHNQTLVVGWHGTVSLFWSIEQDGKVSMRAKFEQKLG
jgi:hypothetical protein